MPPLRRRNRWERQKEGTNVEAEGETAREDQGAPAAHPEAPQGSQIQKALDVLLVDAPVLGTKNSNGRDWQKGLPIQKGTPIFKTTRTTNISFAFQGGTNGSFGPDGERLPGNILFATNPSTNKLIVANQ